MRSRGSRGEASRSDTWSRAAEPKRSTMHSMPRARSRPRTDRKETTRRSKRRFQHERRSPTTLAVWARRQLIGPRRSQVPEWAQRWTAPVSELCPQASGLAATWIFAVAGLVAGGARTRRGQHPHDKQHSSLTGAGFHGDQARSEAAHQYISPSAQVSVGAGSSMSSNTPVIQLH